jgi:hypothetical protein
MRGDPPAELDYLRAYYRGIFFATVALKGRLTKIKPQLPEAVREVDRFQTMIKRYADALAETQELHHRQR